jgi:replicative DNA helicase
MISAYTLPDTDFERGLPASVDAERSILGAILLDNECFFEASEKLTPTDFALESHQRIFARISRLMSTGHAVDMVTLVEELARTKETDSIGGVAYLSDLITGLPRRLSITEYVRIVKEKSLLRQVINACSAVITRAADQSEGANEIISAADRELLAIGANQSDETLDSQSLREMALLQEQRKGTVRNFFSTGLLQVDAKVGGYAKGEVTVIGGRPEQGKSCMVAQAVIANCGSGVPVHVFEIEMTSGQLLRRLWAAVSGVPYRKLRRPECLTDVENGYVVKAMDSVSRWPLVIDESSRLTADQMLAKVRISCRRNGTQLVAIDYLQKMKFGGRQDQRFQAVSDAMVAIAQMAKEEKIAVALLSSITEKRDRNEPPVLADLRQSGDIQYEASTALLIHRERDDMTEKLKEQGQIIIAKARSDEGGAVNVRFNKDNLLFE